MSANSGFLNKEGDYDELSLTFKDTECLGRSDTNIYGRTSRYGQRWFFKGVIKDVPDSLIARQRLIKEFDIQIGLKHEGIAGAISYENIEGYGRCIISEWIEGESLSELYFRGTLTKRDCLRIIEEIIEAVGYIHSKGVVHRDLKPSNIMIRKNGGAVVIIDFGLADTDQHIYQKTPAGTLGYASPRQYTAHTPDVSDDIYSLGVIINMLCPTLRGIGKRCMKGRYRSVEQLQHAIENRIRRRKFFVGLLLSVLIISAFIGLSVLNRDLKNRTESLKDEIESMSDTISQLQGSNLETSKRLRDSISEISDRLNKEYALKFEAEQRKSEINNYKIQLNRRLDLAYSRFEREEKHLDDGNNSILRLVGLLIQEKEDFISNNKSLKFTDSEASEMELSFSLHYSKILEEWNERLTKHRENQLTE